MTPHIDRAIPFSPAMHRQLRAGTKTVTRRLARATKPSPYRVVSVRQERLQEITEEDAVREGVRALPKTWPTSHQFYHKYSHISGPEAPTGLCVPTARESFASLIDSIQGAGVWASNPLVVRVELAPLEDK